MSEGSENRNISPLSSSGRLQSGALNEPGKWHCFLSHTQRNAAAAGMALDMKNDLEKRGLACWLDVKMRDRSEAAMKEGVLNSQCVLALITGPVVNIDAPNDPPESNAYFNRGYCLKELRWAREAGIPIQPVIRMEDKRNIGKLLAAAPDDLKDLGQVDFIHLDRSDVDYWQLGISKVIEAFSIASPR